MAKFETMRKAMWIIAGLTLVVSIWMVQCMPETVPVHWNAAGKIDRYGSRYEQLIFPVVIVVLNLIWGLTVRCSEEKVKEATTDKDQKEALLNIKILKVISLAITAFLSITQLIILFVTAKSSSMNIPVIFGKITPALMGMLMIVIGYYMPKMEKNIWFGIRTPWSLYNDTTWRKSNQFGAKMFIVTGILFIATTLFTPPACFTALILTYILVSTAVICIYSYKVYKEEIAKERA